MSTDTIDPDESGETTAEVITLENEELSLSLVPDLGGKMLSLVRKETGSEFLQQSPVDLKNYPRPQYGDSFLPPYAAGFDECFPNVSPSHYHYNDRNIDLPDHGELWTTAWDYDYTEDEILLWTHGKQLSYRFAKHIKLQGASLEITYEIENLEKMPFDYIWSAHPLLNISSGDELLLPDEISTLLINWSSREEVGGLGDSVSWPKILGNNTNIDFNYVQDKSLGMAIKLFSNRLKNGRAGVYKKDTDESLIFTFDVNQVPYLGIWLCYGGWPAGAKNKDFTLALEPCSARPDSLETACCWEDQQQISPFAVKCWQLELDVVAGKSNL
jgi:galactose mutarotase-like enzyme